MKVILLQDVAKVGRKYEIANVSNGYGANMLIPKSLAVVATAVRIKEVELLRTKQEAHEAVQQELLLKSLDELAGKTVTLSIKANEHGGLFEGVHTDDIISAVREQMHLELNEEMIKLEDPIKTTGEHVISVYASGKDVAFTLSILPT